MVTQNNKNSLLSIYNEIFHKTPQVNKHLFCGEFFLLRDQSYNYPINSFFFKLAGIVLSLCLK
jgi:hypothetical protein